MARPSKTESVFNAFIDHLADAVAARLEGRLPKGSAARKSPLAGKKLDMSCRVAGCRNDSKGPRFGFMCEEHSRLPKKEQEAARAAWKSKHGGK